MKVLVALSRILVGVLFIFSGFIKANDPLGFAYKLDEYFEVFGTEFLIPLSLLIAMFMCILEMILGFMLLLGARMKFTLWMLMLLIIFFGFLTFYSAYFDAVKSCGCFGDAIPLTPWESFIKDMVLLVLVLVIIIGRSHVSPLLGIKGENVLVVLFSIAALAFPIYTYSFLPVIDFRPYAIGNNIPEQTIGTPDKLKFIYVLKDKKTGEEKEFDHWPENWDKLYDYVTNKTEVIEKGIEPKIKDFTISTLEGDDITKDIITNEKYNFLLIAYSLSKTSTGVQHRINDFYELCSKDGVEFICLTASSNEEVASFISETKAAYPFYSTDGTVLKTMIRSNPGLMLLKGGVVIDMWHHNSFPSYSSVKEKFIK